VHKTAVRQSDIESVEASAARASSARGGTANLLVLAARRGMTVRSDRLMKRPRLSPYSAMGARIALDVTVVDRRHNGGRARSELVHARCAQVEIGSIGGPGSGRGCKNDMGDEIARLRTVSAGGGGSPVTGDGKSAIGMDAVPRSPFNGEPGLESREGNVHILKGGGRVQCSLPPRIAITRVMP